MGKCSLLCLFELLYGFSDVKGERKKIYEISLQSYISTTQKNTQKVVGMILASKRASDVSFPLGTTRGLGKTYKFKMRAKWRGSYIKYHM